MLTANQITQTPDEKFSALVVLTNDVETTFISLGELLCDIKYQKLYRFKGYEKFKDMIEDEFAFSGAIASKLINIYEVFIDNAAYDPQLIQEIGYEKIRMILPLCRKADYDTIAKWVNLAEQVSVSMLREAIKNNKPPKDLNLKEVFVEQFKETFCNLFNCSWKEAQFKLALYMADTDQADIKNAVKIKQRQFEQSLQMPEPIKGPDIFASENVNNSGEKLHELQKETKETAAFHNIAQELANDFNTKVEAIAYNADGKAITREVIATPGKTC